MQVVLVLGSESDRGHAGKIASFLSVDWGLSSDIIVASAHKVPEKVYEMIVRDNAQDGLIYITIAGRSNALSGVIAANSVHPVVACPPFKDKDDMMVNIHSTLQMPSETPVLTVLDPSNCAAVVARLFGLSDKGMKRKILTRIQKVKEKFDF